MFIDVTRYGGMRLLRLQVSAIAYLDAVEGGTAVHLVGGETLRVNEDPQQVEDRVDATMSLSIVAVQSGDRRIEYGHAGTINPKLERAAIDSAEAAGIISAVGAAEQRCAAATSASPPKPKKAGARSK